MRPGNAGGAKGTGYLGLLGGQPALPGGTPVATADARDNGRC
jgi:hypothetical protein